MSTHDPKVVDIVAAAIWTAEYREMVGEPPYPWDSPEWEEPGNDAQMDVDRAKARAALDAIDALYEDTPVVGGIEGGL